MDAEYFLIVACLIGCYLLAWWQDWGAAMRAEGRASRGAVWGRIRARGWGLLLPVLTLQFTAISPQYLWLILGELIASGLVMIYAPRLAARAVYLLLGLAIIGVALAKSYAGFNETRVRYGIVLGGAGSWQTHLVFPEAALFALLGAWLFLRLRRRIPAGDGGRPPHVPRGRRPWLALGGAAAPVLAMVIELVGPRDWLGVYGWTKTSAILVAIITLGAGAVLILRAPERAAWLAVLGMLLIGAYGIMIAVVYRAVPGRLYGVVVVDDHLMAGLGGLGQGISLIAAALWLTPRIFHGPPDPVVAAQTWQLASGDADLDPARRRGHGRRRAAQDRA